MRLQAPSFQFASASRWSRLNACLCRLFATLATATGSNTPKTAREARHRPQRNRRRRRRQRSRNRNRSRSPIAREQSAREE